MKKTAIEMVGESGARAMTVRRLAEAVSVSAPLVIFHFGSKKGLLEACDEEVMRTIVHAMKTFATDEGEATLHSLLAVDEAAAAIAYIGRSMQDGDDAGRWWFDKLFELYFDGFEEMTAMDRARPTDDPTMRALLVLSMELGMLFLRPLIEPMIGADLVHPAVMERWAREETDLLAHGIKKLEH